MKNCCNIESNSDLTFLIRCQVKFILIYVNVKTLQRKGKFYLVMTKVLRRFDINCTLSSLVFIIHYSCRINNTTSNEPGGTKM